MRIVDFNTCHIEQAERIAKQNYDEECGHIPVLPSVVKLPCLKDFADSNRGVALIEEDRLLGFLCWLAPVENLFGTEKGAWSPVHAHGAVVQNRTEIYDRLYQAAGGRLTAEGVLCHSVTLYEHDTDANLSFAHNGFGKRCVDAIRATDTFVSSDSTGIVFRQAGNDDAGILTEMRNNLGQHLSGSPMFMPFARSYDTADTEEEIISGKYYYFLAYKSGQPVAYYRIQKTAETFISYDPSMMNISGAFAIPEVRGKGISSAFLSWLMDWLRNHGYSLCGVDFECFNYTARKFWLKYFTAYTNSVVRRIDERIRL